MKIEIIEFGDYIRTKLPDSPLRSGLMAREAEEQESGGTSLMEQIKPYVGEMTDEQVAEFLMMAGQVVLAEFYDAPDAPSLLGMAILFGMVVGTAAERKKVKA